MNPTLELSELDAKIGRLFMAGMPGPELDAGTEALIREYCLGGVILFGRNIEDPLQLATLCKDLQERAITYHGIPLFLAVDQEGGPVARLRAPFTQFPGNTALGASERPVETAEAFARVTAREMSLVGLNMNLAPVLDVRGPLPERHLVGRTFSDNSEQVALLGRTVVRGLQENGVMAVAKHFPGLGGATLDPHHHLPTIHVDAREMEEVQLIPFRQAIEEGVCGIMTSHAIYPAIAPGIPATLSPEILMGLLRRSLGFEGLLITDDLEMGAIHKKWGAAAGAIAAFEAGADILLICEAQQEVLGAIREVRNKIIRGDIPFQRLQQSVDRIMKAKNRFLKDMKEIRLEEVRAYFVR